MPKSLTCVDLFAGAGGLSAGFKHAGFNLVAALESVARFGATHSTNFPECKTVVQDIRTLSPADFERTAALSKRKIDVLIGGPPCQTFSTIGGAKIRHVSGKDVRLDPRNYLFQTFLEYVSYFEPSLFVMENVPQLQTKYSGVLFSRLIEMIDEMGYSVHLNILNAVEFGVPQSRRRLFVVGVKDGGNFSFPTAAFFSETRDKKGKSAKYRTVEDAISDLPKIYDGCRFGKLPYASKPKSDFQRVVRSKSGVVDNNVCRVSNERAKKVFAHMKPGDRYMDLPPSVRRILPFREDIFFDRLKRLVPNQPSWTVLAHIGMDGYMYIHPTEDRTLSVREAARLQGFHDDFTFTGNMREQYVQVGNAVPPMLAHALALEVAKTLQ